jgi:hypothetical protein
LKVLISCFPKGPSYRHITHHRFRSNPLTVTLFATLFTTCDPTLASPPSPYFFAGPSAISTS